jgi:hypothetical protein
LVGFCCRHTARIFCVHQYTFQGKEGASPAAGLPTIVATIGQGSMLRCSSGEFCFGRLLLPTCCKNY